jgi:hypothetical protein
MARNHRDEAIVALIDRDLARAADDYTRAAYGTLAGVECEGDGRDLLGENARWAGFALSYLLLAGACYRANGENDRAAARCRAGIAVARDLQSAVLADPLDRACCAEFVGDFRVVGDVDSAIDAGTDTDGDNEMDAERNAAAYEEAADAYEAATAKADDPLSWASEPMASGAYRGPHQIARNGSHNFEWDEMHGSDPDSLAYLARRPRFKRSRLPAAVEGIVETGYVHPPRGTTEHNNATWRCPNCERSEVNWIAGETICLDCSVRMEEQ